MKKVWSVVLTALCVAAMAAPAGAATVKAVYGANPAGDAVTTHEMISGSSIQLRAVVSGLADGQAVYASWSYGNGSDLERSEFFESDLDAFGFANVESADRTYTYAGSQRSPYKDFTATVSVYDAPVDGTLLGSASTKVRVWDAAFGDAAAVAKLAQIESALWFLHKRVEHFQTAAGAKPAGLIDRYDAGTVMCGQAFVDAGHRASGAPGDPYTDDVNRIVNFVVERLSIASVAGYDGPNNPEAREYASFETARRNLIDGLGVYFTPRDGETEYGFGPATRFVATCGLATQKVPFDSGRNFSGNAQASLTDWNFQELAQQMVDWLAWAQLYDVGNVYPSFAEALGATKDPARQVFRLAGGEVISQGSWPYFTEGWGTQDAPADPTVLDDDQDGTLGDISISWWTVQGLQAADLKGLKYPAAVKTELLGFLERVRTLWAPLYAFGPHQDDMHFVERAGQALSLYKWADAAITADDPRVQELKNFIDGAWCTHNFQAGQDHFSLFDHPATCYDESDPENPVPVVCYSHYECGAFEVRGLDPGEVFYLDDLNIHAMSVVTKGLNDWALSVTPACTTSGATACDPGVDAGLDFKAIYGNLLSKNQLPNGGWSDNAWIRGYEMGTAWAIQTLLGL